MQSVGQRGTVHKIKRSVESVAERDRNLAGRYEIRTKTQVFETATCEHTGTAGAASSSAATSAALLLGLLDVDRLRLGLRVVAALLRLATVSLLRRWWVVTLLGLTVALLLGVACM